MYASDWLILLKDNCQIHSRQSSSPCCVIQCKLIQPKAVQCSETHKALLNPVSLETKVAKSGHCKCNVSKFNHLYWCDNTLHDKSHCTCTYTTVHRAQIYITTAYHYITLNWTAGVQCSVQGVRYYRTTGRPLSPLSTPRPPDFVIGVYLH